MKILYIDRERLENGEQCVAIRDEQGNTQYDDEVVGFGFYRMRCPHGKPLTPRGPAAWVETYNLLTVRTLAIVSSTISILAILAIVRWVSQP